MLTENNSNNNSNDDDYANVLLETGFVHITKYRNNIALQQEIVDYCVNILQGKEESINGAHELSSILQNKNNNDSNLTKCFLDVPFELFKNNFTEQFCYNPLQIAKKQCPILNNYEDKFKVTQLTYYTKKGKLGWHRDRIQGLTDEEQLLITSPVVSVSLGNECVFSYKPNGWKDKEISVHLKSGDIVVFSGPQRMMWHAVKKIYGDETKPNGLNMRGLDGRINITFREGTYYPENSSPSSSINNNSNTQ